MRLAKGITAPPKKQPTLLEWFKSPIIYCSDAIFATEFNTLAKQFYSPRRCFIHYLHMAAGNARDYLIGRELVALKKYLYVFRPLLACRWIERQHGPVPMLLGELVESVLDEGDVRAALAELVARKRAGEELAVAPPIETLSNFIEAELPRLEALSEPDDTVGDVGRAQSFLPSLRAG